MRLQDLKKSKIRIDEHKPLNKEQLKQLIIELRFELPFIEETFGYTSISARIIRTMLKRYSDFLLYGFNAKVVNGKLVENVTTID